MQRNFPCWQILEQNEEDLQSTEMYVGKIIKNSLETRSSKVNNQNIETCSLWKSRKFAEGWCQTDLGSYLGPFPCWLCGLFSFSVAWIIIPFPAPRTVLGDHGYKRVDVIYF